MSLLAQGPSTSIKQKGRCRRQRYMLGSAAFCWSLRHRALCVALVIRGTHRSFRLCLLDAGIKDVLGCHWPICFPYSNLCPGQEWTDIKDLAPSPPFYFGLKTVSCSPSWLQTCYVAKADFKQLIILLPLPNASKILGMHHLISLRASLLGEWTTRLNHFHYKM